MKERYFQTKVLSEYFQNVFEHTIPSIHCAQ